MIPYDVLEDDRITLLRECGVAIRRLVAGLSMPDWPEGTRRAISFTLSSHVILPAGAGARFDTLLDSYRQADGLEVDNEGD